MAIKLISKFKPLYGTKYRYCINTGGRGSSKSFHVADFLLKLTYEEGHKILVTRYTMVSAIDSVIPEFVEKMEMYGVQSHFEVTKTKIINKHTRSEIIFKGIRTSSGNQTAALKSLQGITTFVLDEAEELSGEQGEEIFDKIDESVRKKGVQNRVIIILNPTTKEHWIYKRFFEDAGVNAGANRKKGDTVYIHTTYLDNKANLNPSLIKKFEKLKVANPSKYKHRIMGGWLSKADGAVFTNWRTGDFINCGHVLFGQDYGYAPDPSVLCKISIDKKRKKIYIHECFVQEEMSTEQLANRNKKFCGERSLIIGDSSEPRLINDIKKRGLNIKPCVKGAGSIIAGINIMLDYELIVTPESKNVIKELNNYTYSDKKSQLVIDDYNHCIDAIRYAVYYVLRRSKGFRLRQRN